MGMFYSGLIKELTTKLAWLFILTPEKTETLSAAKGSVLVSSLTLSGIIDNISKISKFLLRFIYIIIISSFIYRIIKLNTIDESDLFLSALIIFYPLVFFMYYSYGGFGVGVRRTAAAGTPLIAMLLPYLLVKIGSVKRQKVLRGLMVCIILLSIGTQLPLLVQNDQYTAAEVASVEFAGEKVPQDELIFTEPTIGNSLIYYNQKGISFVRVVYRGWEQKLLRIYFEPNSSETRSGVQSVLRNQLRETSNVGNNDGGTHYVFTTKKLHKQGISLETIKYNRNPGPEFYRSFDKNYNRVYNSGDELLYSTPS